MKLPSSLARLRPAQLLVLALAPLALLLWFGWQLGGPKEVDPANVTARPALWQATKGGARLWLFGTIHVVPKGQPWLSPEIAKAVDGSDQLYLEVTGLDAERKSRAIFEKLGRGSNLAPLSERLSDDGEERFSELQRSHRAALGNLDGYDSWAAALLINAAAASDLALTSAEAGETLLSNRFVKAGKSIHGLETIEQQLGLFDRLPESEQRQLLEQSLAEAKDAPALYRTLHSAWAKGDTDRIQREFLASLQHSPALRDALVYGRNKRWARLLDRDLADHMGTVMVAVGIGHLIGDKSLATDLQALGWTITRIQ